MKLSLDERIELLDGFDVWRLKHFNKLKPLMMADGPHGLRKQTEFGDNLGISGSEVAVCYPTSSLLASTFNKELVRKMASTLALDAKASDVQIVLGPAINIKRNPLCGRNFEYFSEDPYLTGVLAYEYIKGMENKGVGTSLKHFFANNQEKYRFLIDSIIDDRTLHDIYLKAFKMAVKASPATIMASYNKINGIYGTEHPIVNNLLRDKWKYDGVIVSDWGAIDNRIESLKAGLDLEMPSSKGYNSNLIKEEIKKDESLKEFVNISSNRIIKMIDKYQKREEVKVDLNIHHEKAIEFATDGMILLKNEDDILPLNKDSEILFVGGFVNNMRFQGGGSSYINPFYVNQIDKEHLDYFNNSKTALGYSLDSDSNDLELMNEAITLASKAEKIVYFMGLPERLETEGLDRKNIEIPENQLNLLKDLLLVNENIVVVLLTGSVININFKDKVKGIVLSYLAGEGSAKAILNILSGKASPSGRLPETWIKSLDDLPFSLNENNNAVYYDETIFVGYRYYNTFGREVNYPFGYGLSYANFKYDNFEIEKSNDHAIIKFNLTNQSNIPASEVVQIYLEKLKSSTYQARKQLVAFDKVFLNPLETKVIEIIVNYDDFKYYDKEYEDFILETNSYHLLVSKNVEEVIHDFEVNLKGIDTKLVSNPWEIYNNLNFRQIYGKDLPAENIVYKKPYTISSPLMALNNSFVGRQIVKFILKEATNELKDTDSWISDNVKETLLETPLRCIASFGGDAINHLMALGLVDLANNKFLKGYRKFRKGQKVLKK